MFIYSTNEIENDIIISFIKNNTEVNKQRLLSIRTFKHLNDLSIFTAFYHHFPDEWINFIIHSPSYPNYFFKSIYKYTILEHILFQYSTYKMDVMIHSSILFHYDQYQYMYLLLQLYKDVKFQEIILYYMIDLLYHNRYSLVVSEIPIWLLSKLQHFPYIKSYLSECQKNSILVIYENTILEKNICKLIVEYIFF